jgi:hypothetical protein
MRTERIIRCLHRRLLHDWCFPQDRMEDDRTMESWFDTPVVGQLPPIEAAARLREVGENDAADLLEDSEQTRAFDMKGIGPKRRWPFQDRPWQHTSHVFGYLAPAAPGSGPLPIRAIGSIPADPGLQQARITITLSRLRAASYPGSGMHRILLHCSAQNQVPGQREDAHFNSTYRVWDGDHAGVQGYPLFVGLCVDGAGLSLKCRTINVSNDQDEALLAFLESAPFTSGLKLATTAQPVIAPFSAMALGLANTLCKRHRNVAVQDFDLGLDFGTNPLGGRLAEGAYLAVQLPESLHPLWNWDEWVYSPSHGQVVSRQDPQHRIPYNYLVFSISRHTGT